jgi:hypothetical protein
MYNSHLAGSRDGYNLNLPTSTIRIIRRLPISTSLRWRRAELRFRTRFAEYIFVGEVECDMCEDVRSVVYVPFFFKDVLLGLWG